MEVISVHVGLPKGVRSGGDIVSTAIWKAPVDGPVRVGRLNLDGDAQADLTVHGGPNKAVYAYPAEHYEFWRRELPNADLAWGAFGENLTVRGLMEADVSVGDELSIGTTVLAVTQPRLPCYKLGVRFGRADMVKRFYRSRRTGFYFRVVREGSLRTGDAIRLRPTSGPSLTMAQLVALFAGDLEDDALLRRGASLDGLPRFWREMCQERLTGG